MEELDRQMDVEFSDPKYLRVNFEYNDNLFIGSIWNRTENHEHAPIVINESISRVFKELPKMLLRQIDAFTYKRINT